MSSEMCLSCRTRVCKDGGSMSFEPISDLKPIGYLESCYRDKFGTPRQPGLSPQAWSRLKIRADLQPEQALQGLEKFSHIWLVFVFHQNKVSRYHAKVHPPRLGGESMGVFATRSPHRPNPIGLSLVELVRVEGDSLILAGADLVDGTPILDIKPYIPEIEAKPEARTGWLDKAERRQITVEFLPDAETVLNAWQNLHPDKKLREVIVDTLKLDPRPVLYRGYENEESPYRSDHAFRLLDGDIHFRFTTLEHVQVFKILLMHN